MPRLSHDCSPHTDAKHRWQEWSSAGHNDLLPFSQAVHGSGPDGFEVDLVFCWGGATSWSSPVVHSPVSSPLPQQHVGTRLTARTSYTCIAVASMVSSFKSKASSVRATWSPSARPKNGYLTVTATGGLDLVLSVVCCYLSQDHRCSICCA